MSFTFVLLIAPQNLFPALAPLRIALLAGLLAIGSHVVDSFMNSRPIWRSSREMVLTACLVGWAVITIPFSYWPGGSVAFLLEFYFKSLAIFWLLASTVTTVARLRRVAWGLTLMGVPLALTGIQQYRSGNFLQAGQNAPPRIVGYDAPLTGNPNDLALMLTLIIPLTVGLCSKSRRLGARLLLIAIIGVYAVAIVVTFSRAGFIMLATTLLLYVWKRRKRPGKGLAVAVLVVALLGVPLLPAGYLQRLGTIVDVEEDPTGSAQARRDDTFAALRLVGKNPLIGGGVGMDHLALNEERGPSWQGVHDVYLQYAVDLGLPGLGMFVLLFASCIKAAALSQQAIGRVPPTSDLLCLAEGVQISLLAFAVGALFYPVAYHFYFYYLAGLAMAVREATIGWQRSVDWKCRRSS